VTADSIIGQGLGLPQKLVELRAGNGQRLLASVSPNAEFVVMPLPNEQGGTDQVVFRYSGAKDENCTEIWTPEGGGPRE
jgi:hypothetical protein